MTLMDVTRPNTYDEKTISKDPPQVQESASVENGSVKILQGHTGDDEALKYVHTAAITIDAATNTRICRKIDWHVLPWMCILYLLQYLDKTSLSYASAMGIKADTHMSASQYSWAGSIFYIGYLALVYPHNRLFQVFPPGKYISIAVIVWGAILACHAACSSAAGVLTCRFFLGAMEGAVTAGFVLITSRWYRTDEQTFRTGIWFCFNGVAQIVGGLLAYGVAKGFEENTSITFPAWKALFLLVGLMTAAFGVAMYFFLADSPVQAKWLSEEDRILAVERLRSNQQGLGSRVFKWYQVKEALTDVRTWLLFLFGVTSDIPNGGITVYFTQLIQSYGFDAKTTFLVSMPGGLVEVVSGLGIPWLAARYGQRYLGAVGGMLCGLFGISLMAGLAMHNPLHDTIGQLVGYYLTIGNSATALILILGTISSNTAGYTKKTTVNAINAMGYCVGFIIGPQTFRDGPYYYDAKYNIIAQWVAAAFCCLGLYFVNRRANKKREAQWIADGCPPQPPGQEFEDLTDGENRYFRYAL